MLKSKLLFLGLFLIGSTWLQPLWSQTVNEYIDDGLGVASGTLNVVVGNRKGFVIATDSRLTLFKASGSISQFRDDGQKLFRTGDRSALSFAGIAEVKRFDFEVAKLLRGLCVQMKINGTTATDWLMSVFYQRLNILALTLDAAGHRVSPFSGLECELDSNRVPVFRKTSFYPKHDSINAYTVLTTFDVKSWPIKVAKSFAYETVGIDSDAKAILEGKSNLRTPAVLRYLRLRQLNHLDSLTVDEMEALVNAIFKETIRRSQFVGGPVQMGSFSADGRVVWHQNSFPDHRSYVFRSIIVTPHFKSMLDDFVQPLDVPFNQFIVANEFTQDTIVLSRFTNYLRNTFNNCTFVLCSDSGSFTNNIFTGNNILLIPETLRGNARSVGLDIVAKHSQIHFIKKPIVECDPPGWHMTIGH